MKRYFALICLLLLSLTGCGKNNSSNTPLPAIDQYSWQMTSVQSVEADGQAVAYAPGESSTLGTAVEIILTCSAADGNLLLTDKTNGTTYSGTYKIIDTSQESIVYEVTVGATEGMAVVSMTTYHDDSQTPTLIISLDDYSLNFFAGTE